MIKFQSERGIISSPCLSHYIKSLFVSILQILNLRYFRHFRISKYIGIESFLFAINLDVTSFFKNFSTFDFMFL